MLLATNSKVCVFFFLVFTEEEDDKMDQKMDRKIEVQNKGVQRPEVTVKIQMKVQMIEIKHGDGNVSRVFNPRPGWKQELQEELNLSNFLDMTDGKSDSAGRNQNLKFN